MDLTDWKQKMLIVKLASPMIALVYASIQGLIGYSSDAGAYNPPFDHDLVQLQEQLAPAESFAAERQESAEELVSPAMVPAEPAAESPPVRMPWQVRGAVERCDDEGEARACAEVGDFYYLADAPRFDEARAYYDKAGRGGANVGCVNLGIMFEEGYAGTRDIGRAGELYAQSCTGAIVIGCANLAQLYRRGKGKPQDYRSALVLFRRACDAEDGDGCYGLAAMNAAGEGTKIDKSLARYLFKRACKLGRRDACSA
jgi:TPR repeat protein